MRRLATLAATAAALGFGTAGPAQATLMGGPVPFSFGGSTTYNYVGASTASFTTTGGGTLQLASAAYGNSFGTAHTDLTGQAIVFSSTDAIGSTKTIAPGYSPFLLYFHTNGTMQSSPCVTTFGADCAATLFSNGATAGDAGGNDGGQADLAIYYAASTGTYAFFFDDGGTFGLTGGPGSAPNDDNDYNDLVVTFTPATTVPEPLSVLLLGTGLVGLSLVRRVRPTG